MSRGVRPASAIAARQASSVSSSGSRPSRRPTSDWPIPVIAARRSRISITRLPRRLEEREPDVFALLEDHAHAHADAHALGRAAHDVRHQAQARLLVDLDDRDRVGMVGRGNPGLVVQREGERPCARPDTAATSSCLP